MEFFCLRCPPSVVRAGFENRKNETPSTFRREDSGPDVATIHQLLAVVDDCAIHVLSEYKLVTRELTNPKLDPGTGKHRRYPTFSAG